jgi:hypothetical protein
MDDKENVMRTWLRTFLVPGLIIVSSAGVFAQSAPDPTGHWEGTITAPFGQIDFELDVAKDAAGSLVATYGQKAQGLRGLPLSNVALDSRILTFVLMNGGPGGGVFTAEILAGGTAMAGEVVATNGTVPFSLNRTGDAQIDPPVRNAAVSKALEGRWSGTMEAGGRQIGLILTIENRADGTASAVIAQVDRPALQLPALLKETGTSVAMDVKATSGSFAGTVNSAGTEITGTWTQGGGSLPLAFQRAN